MCGENHNNCINIVCEDPGPGSQGVGKHKPVPVRSVEHELDSKQMTIGWKPWSDNPKSSDSRGQAVACRPPHSLNPLRTSLINPSMSFSRRRLKAAGVPVSLSCLTLQRIISSSTGVRS